MTRTRAALCAAAATLALAGCSASSPSHEAVAAERAATSSFLENRADIPITYNPLGKSEDEVLPPGESLRGPGGVWLVPDGMICFWNSPGRFAPPVAVSAMEHRSGTTFTGETMIIEECR